MSEPHARRSAEGPLVCSTEPDPAQTRFREQWGMLEQRAQRIPVHHAVALAGGPESKLAVATARHGDRLVGVWPFQLEQRGPIRVATAAGGPLQVYDGPTLDAACDPIRTTRALWLVIKHWPGVDVVQMTAILPDSPVHAIPLVQPHVRVATATARVRLSNLPDAAALVAQQPKHRRKSVRRRARALAQRGPITFATLLDPIERAHAIQWAIDTKLAWLDAHDQLGATVRSQSFQSALRALAGSEAALVVHRLTVGDQTAAVELGYRDVDVYHSFLGTFSPAFEKEGVGVDLTLRTIDWSIQSGLRYYDLLAPVTPFKTTWADHQRTVCSASVPLTMRGRLAAPLRSVLRSRLKQLASRLPPQLRTALVAVRDRASA